MAMNASPSTAVLKSIGTVMLTPVFSSTAAAGVTFGVVVVSSKTCPHDVFESV